MSQPFYEGDVVTGEITKVTINSVYVNFEGNGYGVLRISANHSEAEYYPHSEIKVVIESVRLDRNGNNFYTLSTEQRRLASQLRTAFSSGHNPGEIVEAEVASVADGCLYLDVNGYDGFVKSSNALWDKSMPLRSLYKPGDRLLAVFSGYSRSHDALVFTLKFTDVLIYESAAPVPADADVHVGDSFDCAITKIDGNGVFVSFPSSDHIGLIAPTSLVPSEVASYKVGNTIPCVVARVFPIASSSNLFCQVVPASSPDAQTISAQEDSYRPWKPSVGDTVCAVAIHVAPERVSLNLGYNYVGLLDADRVPGRYTGYYQTGQVLVCVVKQMYRKKNTTLCVLSSDEVETFNQSLIDIYKDRDNIEATVKSVSIGHISIDVDGNTGLVQRKNIHPHCKDLTAIFVPGQKIQVQFLYLARNGALNFAINLRPSAPSLADQLSKLSCELDIPEEPQAEESPKNVDFEDEYFNQSQNVDHGEAGKASPDDTYTPFQSFFSSVRNMFHKED